jgi:hypothetical protein
VKESKAELVKRLEKIFAAEDYFPGYLGNPNSFGAFGATIPAARRRKASRKPPRKTSRTRK